LTDLREPDLFTTHWIETLLPFQRGLPALPKTLASRAGRRATSQAVCRLPAVASSPGLDVLGFAALVLVARRYNGGEGMVIASPAASPSGSVVFLTAGGADGPAGVTAAAFLDRCAAEITDARRHEPCPVDRVIAGMGLDEAAAADTLWQIGYVCGDGADVTTFGARVGALLHVVSRGDDVLVDMHASGAVVGAAALEALAQHVARAIEWLAVGGDRWVDDFDLVSDVERERILAWSTGPAVPLPAGQTVHGLIAAQAQRTPDRVAVIHGDVEVSYRALDEQSTHLAGILRRDFRVTGGTCVGVMLERSAQMPIALCGVMKAGAAYVPINPRHPWETIRYMLENAGISVVIVDSESIASAANFSGDLLVLDIELRGPLPAAPVAAAPVVEDTALAYVIYTSGSTGRPKGVGVEHRAVVNTICWRNDFYGIGDADVNLQIPSFAFDSSVVDIFCVLTVGGTLVVPAEDMRLDARRLLALSVARGVTSCIVTPSYYQLLLSDLAGGLPTLRWVTLAGETATPELVAAHLASLPGVRLCNEYGPTENAVCSTACWIDAPEPTVSIGRPIWNVTVLLVDAAGRLVPAGVPGEIYLGGAGLARGYLNQDAQTAERFVDSPVPDVFPGRVYRTGDRACWRPDGQLEFLGRLDSQVKIRGVRIEIDEVEHALRAHAGVKAGAVVCKTDAGGAKYLAAYAEPHARLTAAELRAHMAAALPVYMLPDTYTVLTPLPLNLNGKIDRATLTEMPEISASESADAAPLSPVQSALVALWGDVLKRGPVALDDNFFTMGGNSLRVMEVTSRMRGELSLNVELLDIYAYPTIRELTGRQS
jgi:bacitracin synthase 3